jgi:hypothetical protein
MAASDNSGGGGMLDRIGTQIAQQAIDSLPPDVQALLRPGKQSDRINRAIGWAARRDPEVIRLHQQHGAKHVRTLEDVRALPLEQMDHVAHHVTARYRRYAAWTGAVTGLPGGLWALVAAGADVQFTAIYAVRMAAGVAQAYGFDTSLPEELAQLAEVLALVAGVDSLRGIGNWITREGLTHMLPEILPRLLARVGTEITREQAAKAAGRIVPGVGAAIGAAIDYSFLRVAGDRAIKFYHERYLVDHGLAPARVVEAGPAIAALPPGVGRAVAPPPPAPAGSAAQSGGVAAPAPAVIPAPHPRERPPERFVVNLAIFAVLALLITIAACAALIILATNGVQHLLHP